MPSHFIVEGNQGSERAGTLPGPHSWASWAELSARSSCFLAACAWCSPHCALAQDIEYSGCLVGLCGDGCQAQDAFPSWRWEVTAEEVSVLSSAFVRFPKSRLSQASKRTSQKYSSDPWGPSPALTPYPAPTAQAGPCLGV